MAIVYRAIKGSRLTVTEIDGNFEELSDLVNTKVDSANVRTLVDSAYVRARQLNFDFMDSGEVIALVDSAYVNARLDDTLFMDSAEVINLVDSAYVNARLDDTLFLDSAEVIALVDSAYINARVSFDSDDRRCLIQRALALIFCWLSFNSSWSASNSSNEPIHR